MSAWATPVAVATDGLYSGLSLVAGVGVLWLAAVDLAGGEHIFYSETLGATWLSAVAAPPVSAGSGLGLEQTTGRLLFGTGRQSLDGSHTWPSA